MANPPLVVADVAGWTSQGCFLDNLAPYQLLPTTNFTSDALTPDACGTFCTGYKYFGLEDGEYDNWVIFVQTNSSRLDLLLRKRSQ